MLQTPRLVFPRTPYAQVYPNSQTPKALFVKIPKSSKTLNCFADENSPEKYHPRSINKEENVRGESSQVVIGHLVVNVVPDILNAADNFATSVDGICSGVCNTSSSLCLLAPLALGTSFNLKVTVVELVPQVIDSGDG